MGGLNVILLGLIGGLGLFLGDSVYIILGYHGGQVLADSKRVDFLVKGINKLPPWSVNIIVYFYFSSFLPNDVVLIFFGLVKYSYRKLIIPLLFGDITFVIIVAWLAVRGIKLFT